MLDRMRTWLQQTSHWTLQETHKAKVKQLCVDVEKAFTEHPETTGETYLQHLWFTAKMSGRFVYTSVVIVFHGLFPFLCVRTASNQIEQVYRIMKTRIPVKRREEIDKEIRLPIRLHTHHGDARVAIIGGGFSGALVLANLVEQANINETTGGNLSIEWFESGEMLGTGVAYGTKDPAHLLNVRAERMGAFSGKPDDFYQWLQTEEGKKHAEKFFPGQSISSESCVPRMLYAEYLKHIVNRSLNVAKEKGIKVRTSQSTIIDASIHDKESQQIMLSIKRGGLQQEALVDAVVLATGNLPPRNHGFQTGIVAGIGNYVEDVWHTPADHIFPSRVQELSADSEIVIIGTGLTMVDTVLTLKSRGYKGTITAISRNGLIPAAHAHTEPYPAWEWVLAPQFAPRTAIGLLTRLREEIRRAEKEGYDWRAVIDSIRPTTQTLWKQLNTAEKRKFLSRLLTFWNVHRHRMSSDIHATLKPMQQSGALKIIAGKIYYVGSDKEGLTVAYRKRGTNRVETIRPALVLNCTGPEYDIAASDHKLLKNLRDRELITVGPLRIGVETTESGTAKGKAPDAIFPVGTLLMGELLECTAVPELRDQALQTATNVLNRIKTLYESDYQAGLVMGASI